MDASSFQRSCFSPFHLAILRSCLFLISKVLQFLAVYKIPLAVAGCIDSECVALIISAKDF